MIVHLTECPRDAMQGIKTFIPTSKKIEYLNQLIEIGFDTLDFGSFVSAKSIPQMSDTAEVVSELNTKTNTRLLSIIANLKGAAQALQFKNIAILGYPFSISETFQKRNTNASSAESLIRLNDIFELVKTEHRQLRVYLSMAFGNPYGDPWNKTIVLEWFKRIYDLGIREIALADTTGSATPELIAELYSNIKSQFLDAIIPLHLHAAPFNHDLKINAALKVNCLTWDSALLGYGGCPMASHELTGNINTEKLLDNLNQHKISHKLNLQKLSEATKTAQDLFMRFT
jgi:hydroxymethylglutaryl-CoA lyase